MDSYASDVPTSSKVLKVHVDTMMYAPVKEEIYIEADVEDAVPVLQAGDLEDETWEPGRWYAVFPWPKDDDPTGAPTKKNVKRYCMENPFIKWTFIPFGD